MIPSQWALPLCFAEASHSIEKQHPYWFYIYGFNIGIIAGLFTVAFSRLLGRRWGAVAAMLGILIYTALVGASFSVLRAAIMGCFRVLTVGSRGATLLLEWDRFRLLLPLGTNLDDLETLGYGDTIGNITALLLADSGYFPSNPPEWIANLRPQVMLLSVSPADKQGLPSPETLELLQGYTLLRTDRSGWIELITDGKQLWVEAERR